MLAGRYELVRFVGRGGMGEVWEGRDRLIERRVAVKLLPHANADASGAALFFREARTAGALHHPGVVAVYDLGQDEGDGSLFLVMEFVEGRDLAAVLDKEGPPAVRTAVEWAAQAAAALARAHTAGIVHRDLKPANLMLTVEDRVKILDFGIARFVESTNRSSKVMGTLAYMPPERFDEQPGDARSDLYSLGCVLHELLTGNVPFNATGPVSMMNAHLRRTPTRPGEHRHGVPAELDDLVLALLAKDPRDRPDTADEVHRRLRAAVDLAPDAETRRMVRGGDAIADAPTIGLDRKPVASGTPRSGDGGGPSKAPTPTRRRLLWLVGGGAVTALGIGGVLELIDSPDDRREPQRTAGDQVPSSPPAVTPTDTTVRWSYSTGAEVDSSPAVVDGVVYIGSHDKNVYALDAATGTKKWGYATGAEVFSSPVVAGGVVYVGSTDKNVYALDAATGTRKWVYTTGEKVASSPVVVGGVVYVGSADMNVYALDAATGAKKWAYTTGGMVWQSPAVVGGVVYVPSNDKNVYALDAATGAKKWAYSIGASTSSNPVVAGGMVYIGSGDKNVYALDAVSGTGP
ncbi:serine/threonine-protein kinase [Embleya sp. NPDC050493]|uniref:serine/threonine-protein kinase n=1 Tax=Embleya sp. NPDC050493 TaxID=3363989 RepID=UPI00378A2F26